MTTWGQPLYPGIQSPAVATPGWRAFTPHVPAGPPSGTYDPALDAARRAGTRGLGDLRQDTQTADLRDTVDYGLGRDDISRGRDRGLDDLRTDYDQQLGGLTRSRERGIEDYDREIATLGRAYQRLGRQQGERARKYGVLSGGLAARSAAIRAENEALDRQPLDTAQKRFLADNERAGFDLTNMFQRQSHRIGEDSDLALGRLGLDYGPPDPSTGFLGGRRFQDRATGLARAGREDVQFGIDTDAQKAFQATGTGWRPPLPGERGGPPRNEFVDRRGRSIRFSDVNGVRVYYDQTGRIVGRKRLGGGR